MPGSGKHVSVVNACPHDCTNLWPELLLLILKNRCLSRAVCTSRSTISNKQAEAEAARAAVSEAASREQSAAKAADDAARRMAELQAELEQISQDERREQLCIQVITLTAWRPNGSLPTRLVSPVTHLRSK